MKTRGDSRWGIFEKLWWGFRQMSGDAAYDVYLRHWRRCGAAEKTQRLLTRKEFYLERIQQRYRTPSRCC
ncbi:MAG: YbdD/YjiX family protein [Candidatus Acidiferrales bacterium]